MLQWRGGVVAPRRTQSPAFSKVLNAPITSCIQGKGTLPADHPNYAGSAWGTVTPVVRWSSEPDCMLIFGSRMGAQAAYDFRCSTFPREVIRVDIDGIELTLNVNPTDTRLAGRLLPGCRCRLPNSSKDTPTTKADTAKSKSLKRHRRALKEHCLSR